MRYSMKNDFLELYHWCCEEVKKQIQIIEKGELSFVKYFLSKKYLSGGKKV
jgi:hypothetical protein